MKSRNVCKFTVPKKPDTLRTLHFVMESNKDIMQHKRVLKSHEAYLVTDGHADFYFDGVKTEARGGTLLFGFYDEPFYCIPSEDCQYIYIGFEGGRAEELFERYGINRIHRTFDGYESLVPLWSEGLISADESSIDIVAEASLLYAFSKLSRAVSGKYDIVNRALNVIEDEFDNPYFSLDVLAKTLGYNSKYLSHILKERLGVGFNEYLKNIRIKHATFLFAHGINSVKNVAHLSGFSDPFYFSSVFKKEMGVSPKEYKEKIKDKKV